MYEVVDAENDNDSPDRVSDNTYEYGGNDAGGPFVDRVLSLYIGLIP